MDTLWLKVAGIVVVIIAVIIGIAVILPENEEKPEEPPKTFQNMVEKDQKLITEGPKATDVKLQNDKQQDNQTNNTPPEPVTFYFTELDEIDKIQAERLLSAIPGGRSMGRLPMYGTGGNFNLLVQSCTQLMSSYPGSIYDYKARRALSRIPRHYWQRYKITEEMIDLSMFTKQRANTYKYAPREENQ